MLTAVDLFCGAGGLSLGFLRAGFRILVAADNNPFAIASYNKNVADHARLIDLAVVRDLPSADIVCGGPPCQGFSSAGLRKADDHRNSLVKCFASVVVSLRPRTFVFENVEGFLTAAGGARLLELLEPLIDAGYRIHVRKINAANYGVPQHRKRVIAIGALGWNPSFPSPTHTAFGAPGALLASRHLPPTPTVIQAVGDLPAPTAEPPGVPQGHFAEYLEGRDLELAMALQPGHTMRSLPEEFHHPSYRRRAFRRVMDGTPSERRGGAPAGIRRLRPDEPAKAITGGARSEFLHPSEHRPITMRECARLQTFPDDFEFCGSASEQAQLIGNAVPPLLAETIAKCVAIDLRRAQRQCDVGALLSFVPTLSNGFSPVLKEVCSQIHRRFGHGFEQENLALWL